MKTTMLAIVLCLAGAGFAGAQEGGLIFPAQDKHVHGSSIVQCPNGDLLAAWFHGSGERTADDVQIQGARLRQGESEWSAVFQMADTPGFPDCNPVLFIDAQDRLWLFWIRVLANGWQYSLLEYQRADDYQGDGAPRWNWAGVISLKPGPEFPDDIKAGFDALGVDEPLWGEYAPPYSRMVVEAAQDKLKRQIGWMTRIHPLVLSNGRIVLPLYHDGFNLSMVAYSDDTGETWTAGKPIVGLGPIQPTLARRSDGTLVAYMRDSGGPPQRVLVATSTDDGETWTPATDSDIPNPGSSLEVIALRDGRWAMIYNDTESGRHSIALALSDDEGRSWKWKRHLDQGEPRRTGFSYPSMIQTEDGRIHVSYTHSVPEGKSIKHVAVDPDWIRQTP